MDALRQTVADNHSLLATSTDFVEAHLQSNDYFLSVIGSCTIPGMVEALSSRATARLEDAHNFLCNKLIVLQNPAGGRSAPQLNHLADVEDTLHTATIDNWFLAVVSMAATDGRTTMMVVSADQKQSSQPQLDKDLLEELSKLWKKKVGDDETTTMITKLLEAIDVTITAATAPLTTGSTPVSFSKALKLAAAAKMIPYKRTTTERTMTPAPPTPVAAVPLTSAIGASAANAKLSFKAETPEISRQRAQPKPVLAMNEQLLQAARKNLYEAQAEQDALESKISNKRAAIEATKCESKKAQADYKQRRYDELTVKNLKADLVMKDELEREMLTNTSYYDDAIACIKTATTELAHLSLGDISISTIDGAILTVEGSVKKLAEWKESIAKKLKTYEMEEESLQHELHKAISMTKSYSDNLDRLHTDEDLVNKEILRRQQEKVGRHNQTGKPNNPDQHDVFISYRRKNGEHMADLIRNKLQNDNFSVFLDVSPTGLGSGEFGPALEKAISNARCVVVILSSGSLDRCTDSKDWVRKEIALALKLKKKKIVPVKLADFTYPDKTALPADIRDLCDINAVEWSRSYEYAATTKLIDFINECIAHDDN